MTVVENEIPNPHDPPKLRELERIKYLTASLYETLRLHELCVEDSIDLGLSIVLITNSWSRNGIGIDTNLGWENRSPRLLIHAFSLSDERTVSSCKTLFWALPLISDIQ